MLKRQRWRNGIEPMTTKNRSITNRRHEIKITEKPTYSIFTTALKLCERIVGHCERINKVITNTTNQPPVKFKNEKLKPHIPPYDPNMVSIPKAREIVKRFNAKKTDSKLDSTIGNNAITFVKFNFSRLFDTTAASLPESSNNKRIV
jgi:hypothetical protein